MNRRHVLLIVGLVLSGVFLYLFLRGMDWASLRADLGRVNLWILALATVVDFVAFLVMSIRAQMLFQPLFQFGFGEMFRSMLIAYSGNNVLPARAGEFMRAAFLIRRSGLPTASVAGVIAVERLMDAVVVITLALVALPLTMGSIGAGFYVIAGAVLATFAGIVMASRHPVASRRTVRRLASGLGKRMRNKVSILLDRFFEGIQGISSSRMLLYAGLLTMLNWLLTATSIYIWIVACGVKLAWYHAFVVLGSIAVGNAVPSSPGNIGTFHYFVRSALELLGVGQAAAGTVAIVGYFTKVPFTVIGLVYGMPGLLRERRNRAGKKEVDTNSPASTPPLDPGLAGSETYESAA